MSIADMMIADEKQRNRINELNCELKKLTHERDEAREEVERLRQCCTQRGARMQIMRDWMDEPRGLHTPGLWPPTEWYYFTQDRPEAEKWFDDDGVPK